jgi:hypothetical protein
VKNAERREFVTAAAADVGELNDREILIAGAIAYWCEGSKSKPYRPNDRVTFINSDPGLILFFLRFLYVAGVEPDRLVCRVYIHETADVVGAQRFWLDLTGLKPEQFRRPVLKHHNPKTVRKIGGHRARCPALNPAVQVGTPLDVDYQAPAVVIARVRTATLAILSGKFCLLPRKDSNLRCQNQNLESCRLDHGGRSASALAYRARVGRACLLSLALARDPRRGAAVRSGRDRSLQSKVPS